MATLITAFEVPPDADAAFVSAWTTADAVLYRALRADVDFRFVEIGAADVPPPATGAFPAHGGLYEVVREDATPDVEGGVVLINPFEVAAADDERFLAGWDDARGALAGRQGYLGTRLHRAAGAADFRFVDVARWSSPLMVARALQRPDFQRAAEALPFPSHPALYQPVRARLDQIEA
jgi:heme oxygenase (mycobilin-producing)